MRNKRVNLELPIKIIVDESASSTVYVGHFSIEDINYSLLTQGSSVEEVVSRVNEGFKNHLKNLTNDSYFADKYRFLYQNDRFTQSKVIRILGFQLLIEFNCKNCIGGFLIPFTNIRLSFTNFHKRINNIKSRT